MAPQQISRIGDPVKRFFMTIRKESFHYSKKIFNLSINPFLIQWLHLPSKQVTNK